MIAEAAIVLHAEGAPSSLLPALLQRVGIEVLAFTHHHAVAAADAYAAYGRGRHPASLNDGDCMAYAVARLARAPLLLVGGRPRSHGPGAGARGPLTRREGHGLPRIAPTNRRAPPARGRGA